MLPFGASSTKSPWYTHERAAYALGTALLAIWATSGILGTVGEAAVPLDDTYIHFQYARNFALGQPLHYSPGDPPAAGATSLGWALLLAPFWLIGLRGTLLIWPAWLLSWFSLWGVACETQRFARSLFDRRLAFLSGAMVLSFGAFAWCAGSGMEVIPFTYALVATARRAAEYRHGSWQARLRPSLLGFAAAAALLRPEGVLATAMAAAALAAFGRGKHRAWALGALLLPILPMAVNRVFAGTWSSSTTVAKWVFASPYVNYAWPTVNYYVHLLFTTLVNGELWSRMFVPRGFQWVAWLCFPALGIWGWLQKRPWPTLMAAGLGLAMLGTTSYETFLVNRLRYLWPFFPGWILALTALAAWAGWMLKGVSERWWQARLWVAAGFVGAFTTLLPTTMEDLAESASAIHRQQVSLARWVRESLPRDIRLGVNDAGALSYLGERRTFDLVGLTTPGEVRYWNAGAGSRFEHYQRLGAARLPTHWAVYPDWAYVSPICGTLLTDRIVNGSTILGGARMGLWEADYSLLSRGESPLRWTHVDADLVDSVDVADLESESAHSFDLAGGGKADDQLFSLAGGGADGGRAKRAYDDFAWKTLRGGAVVGRWVSASPAELIFACGKREVGRVRLRGLGVPEEHQVLLPQQLECGDVRWTVTRSADSLTASVASLHYWSYRKAQLPLPDPEPIWPEASPSPALDSGEDASSGADDSPPSETP